ncbi:hypothetical protein [Streptomyces sp. NPDC048392]|uniref:hypothetical protein n=1 Tax=Streptomyces sp. NPDC048392 TaxID=3365543 RepID=UPI0037221CC2
MSTQADHGRELVPRPEQTPEALRSALAVVAPGRLPEMQRTKDEAFAQKALRELSAVLDEAMQTVRT